MSFLGDALGSAPAAAAASAVSPTPQPDSPLVFGLKLFGVGAAIAARMADGAFDELDAPILRVGAPFMPVPFARSLEAQYSVSVERICAAIRKSIA